MAATPHQSRKRTCSFSSPSTSKAPRLASSESATSFGSIRDSTMACAINPRNLSQSYIWPAAAAELGRLATSANIRAEHNAYLRNQFESSNPFRNPFADFIIQIAYEQALERAITPSYTSHFPSAPSGTPFPSEFASNPTHPSHVASLRDPPSPRPKPLPRSSTRLIPPRPRVSSPLSPYPPHNFLAGPARRPMPLRKARDASLLKQAVCNTEHGRQIAVLGPHAAARVSEAQKSLETEDVVMEYMDERLGQSWVVVPGEDWEMVDTGEIAIIP